MNNDKSGRMWKKALMAQFKVTSYRDGRCRMGNRTGYIPAEYGNCYVTRWFITASYNPRSILILSCDLRLGLLSGPFPRSSPTKLYAVVYFENKINIHGRLKAYFAIPYFYTFFSFSFPLISFFSVFPLYLSISSFLCMSFILSSFLSFLLFLLISFHLSLPFIRPFFNVRFIWP